MEPTVRVFFDVVMSNHTPWDRELAKAGNITEPLLSDPGWTPVGRIVMELFGESLPITVENFRQLCVGNVGRTWREGADGVPKGYKGSQLFKIIELHGAGRRLRV